MRTGVFREAGETTQCLSRGQGRRASLLPRPRPLGYADHLVTQAHAPMCPVTGYPFYLTWKRRELYSSFCPARHQHSHVFSPCAPPALNPGRLSDIGRQRGLVPTAPGRDTRCEHLSSWVLTPDT